MSKSIQEALHILIDAFEAQNIRPPVEMVLERGELSRLKYYVDLNHALLGADKHGRFRKMSIYGIQFSDATNDIEGQKP